MLHPGTLLAQRYYVLHRIGAGGFATVYKGRDTRGRLVAIKQFSLAGLSPQEKIEVTDSFNREVALLSTLHHKHLPRVLDYFTDEEHWYAVMEFIEGTPLDEVLQASGPLPPELALKIALELCDVLGYLHRHYPPIIYRDVKPSNIMLTSQGHIFLIDFGIARRYRPGQARDTGQLGSPGYAAPEQYGRAQTTPRTDIYGLGATLQTLLTGREPLEIEVNGWPPHCSLPADVRDLLAHMCAYDVNQRPRTMEEVRNEIYNLSIYPSSWKPSYVLALWTGEAANTVAGCLYIMTAGLLIFTLALAYFISIVFFIQDIVTGSLALSRWQLFLLLLPFSIGYRGLFVIARLGRVLRIQRQGGEVSDSGPSRPWRSEVHAALWQWLWTQLIIIALAAPFYLFFPLFMVQFVTGVSTLLCLLVVFCLLFSMIIMAARYLYNALFATKKRKRSQKQQMPYIISSSERVKE